MTFCNKCYTKTCFWQKCYKNFDFFLQLLHKMNFSTYMLQHVKNENKCYTASTFEATCYTPIRITWGKCDFWKYLLHKVNFENKCYNMWILKISVTQKRAFITSVTQKYTFLYKKTLLWDITLSYPTVHGRGVMEPFDI